MRLDARCFACFSSLVQNVTPYFSSCKNKHTHNKKREGGREGGGQADCLQNQKYFIQQSYLYQLMQILTTATRKKRKKESQNNTGLFCWFFLVVFRQRIRKAWCHKGAYVKEKNCEMFLFAIQGHIKSGFTFLMTKYILLLSNQLLMQLQRVCINNCKAFSFWNRQVCKSICLTSQTWQAIGQEVSAL